MQELISGNLMEYFLIMWERNWSRQVQFPVPVFPILWIKNESKIVHDRHYLHLNQVWTSANID